MFFYLKTSRFHYSDFISNLFSFFFISSFKAIFLEFEYEVFEYFKIFKCLLAKFYGLIWSLQKIFWIFVQVKENV